MYFCNPPFTSRSPPSQSITLLSHVRHLSVTHLSSTCHLSVTHLLLTCKGVCLIKLAHVLIFVFIMLIFKQDLYFCGIFWFFREIWLFGKKMKFKIFSGWPFVHGPLGGLWTWPLGLVPLDLSLYTWPLGYGPLDLTPWTWPLDFVPRPFPTPFFPPPFFPSFSPPFSPLILPPFLPLFLVL
jgi:hypothetical protein